MLHDGRSHADRQQRGLTADRAVIIGDLREVKAVVGELGVGHIQDVARRSRNNIAVEIPLIAQQPGSNRGDRKDDVRAGQNNCGS